VTEDRTQKVWNMKLKEKWPTEIPKSGYVEQIRKNVTQQEDRTR